MLNRTSLIYAIVFFPIRKRCRATTILWYRASVKFPDKFFGKTSRRNDIRAPHRYAIILSNHLNRRSCCGARHAYPPMPMRCKKFRQRRIRSVLYSANGRGIDEPAAGNCRDVPLSYSVKRGKAARNCPIARLPRKRQKDLNCAFQP